MKSEMRWISNPVITALIGLTIFIAAQPAMATSPAVARARSFYAKHNYQAAEKIYLAIPESSKEYLLTREELAWTYLRLGNWSALRGILPHLNSPLVRLDWRLEGRVLSSIAYLKDCEYDQVEAEIRKFQNELTPFVAKMNSVLGAPATFKKLTQHQRDVWINRRERTQEAITKMQFVKTELQSQLGQLPVLRAATVKTTGLDAQQLAAQKEIGEASERRWILPGNRDLWSDEAFQMRSLSASLCQSLWVRK
jgi:hypothetical protein